MTCGWCCAANSYCNCFWTVVTLSDRITAWPTSAFRLGRQGQRIGSQLLLYHHAFVHAAGLPAYLHADDPRNHDLYQRHGYTTIGPPILIADTRLPLWAMWREPRASTTVPRPPIGADPTVTAERR